MNNTLRVKIKAFLALGALYRGDSTDALYSRGYVHQTTISTLPPFFFLSPIQMCRKNLFWFWFLNSISQKKKIKKIFLLPSVFIFMIPFWFFTFFHFLLFSIFHPVAFLCFCKKIWDHFNENQFMKNSLKMFLFFCSFQEKRFERKG